MVMLVDPLNALTPRQLEFLALYASGYEIRRIAEIKFVHYNVVQKSLSAAKERVGANSLVHLCMLARESGVIVANGTGYAPVQEERVVGD